MLLETNIKTTLLFYRTFLKKFRQNSLQNFVRPLLIVFKYFLVLLTEIAQKLSDIAQKNQSMSKKNPT